MNEFRNETTQQAKNEASAHAANTPNSSGSTTGLCSGITPNELLSLALDIGENMIICGAEANRVEDTISRICKAYGVYRVDVFSITSQLTVSITMNDNSHDIQTRRIYSYSNDLDRLEYFNAISRYICANTPAYENIEKETAHIKNARNFPWYIMIIGYVLASAAFAVFFGGSLKDGLTAAIIACIAYGVDYKLKPYNINEIIYFFFCTFFTGIIACLFCLAGLCDNLNMVIVGLVMIYIPGLQLTNSIRDMLSGDIMSGLLRMIEAIIYSISIAGGYASAVALIAHISGGLI